MSRALKGDDAGSAVVRIDRSETARDMAQSTRIQSETDQFYARGTSAGGVENGGSVGDGSVSALLRQARERIGYDVVDVAQILRIRAAHIQAIEDGRFKELPGAVYAVGFVRGYAELVGLDAAVLVAQFKRQTSVVKQRPNLVFPAPVPEGGRVPGGAILTLAVLIGGLSYAGWYYLSSANRSIADIVPQLPERFVAFITGDTEPAEPIAAAPDDLAPPAEEEPEPAVTAGLREIGPGERMVAGPVVPGPTAPPSRQAAVTPPLGTGRPVTSAPAPAAVPGIAQPPAAPFGRPAPGIGDASAPIIVAEAPFDRSYGSAIANDDPAPAVGGRILLRATSDSWVQVRDREGSVVMTKVMTSGETYEVPAQEGLRMVTGNAGGLVIEVDGEATPPLGHEGDVIRNVALDATRLRNGTAVRN
jgi:cytoskeleton protein RodZ